jgi:hypothetical protein
MLSARAGDGRGEQAAGILASPFTLAYHRALMLLPLLLLCLDAGQLGWRGRLALAFAIALLTVDYRYWSGDWPLAYPRLLGGLVVLGLALRRVQTTEPG